MLFEEDFEGPLCRFVELNLFEFCFLTNHLKLWTKLFKKVMGQKLLKR